MIYIYNYADDKNGLHFNRNKFLSIINFLFKRKYEKKD